MKEEDLDWVVYHRLSQTVYSTPEEIAAETGLAVPEIENSLRRLEKSLLVGRQGTGCRLLSFQESLFACQLRYDKSVPLFVESGVVKVKKNREE